MLGRWAQPGPGEGGMSSSSATWGGKGEVAASSSPWVSSVIEVGSLLLVLLLLGRRRLTRASSSMEVRKGVLKLRRGVREPRMEEEEEV